MSVSGNSKWEGIFIIFSTFNMVSTLVHSRAGMVLRFEKLLWGETYQLGSLKLLRAQTEFCALLRRSYSIEPVEYRRTVMNMSRLL